MKILIVIDVQNVFVNEKNKFIVNGIKSLIESDKFDKVIFTVFINNEKSSFVKYLNWNKAFRSEGTRIVEDLRSFSDIIIERSTFSAFGAKEILNYISKEDEIYLCGLDTDACVLATAYEGIDIGFDIKVIDDLIFSVNEEMHAIGMNVMRRNIPNILINSKSIK